MTVHGLRPLGFVPLKAPRLRERADKAHCPESSQLVPPDDSKLMHLLEYAWLYHKDSHRHRSRREKSGLHQHGAGPAAACQSWAHSHPTAILDKGKLDPSSHLPLCNPSLLRDISNLVTAALRNSIPVVCMQTSPLRLTEVFETPCFQERR